MEGELTRLNNKENKNMLNETLKREYEPFYKKLLSSYYNDFDQFEKDIKTNYKQIFVEKYSDRMDGVQEQVEFYSEKKIIEGFRYFDKRSKD